MIVLTLAGSITIAVREETGQTANAVAAHLSFGAVGIEDPHAQIPFALGWQGKDHAITTDPEPTVAELPDPARIRFSDRWGQLALTSFQDQEVIAKSLIFAELQHGVLMADPNPMETAPLDPSLPGVRTLQSWIREQLPISIDVIGSERIEGRLIWQDQEFLAIERRPATRPTLINRRQITVIRVLG